MNTGNLLQILALAGICGLYLLIHKRSKRIMANLQDVHAAIEAEKQEIADAIQALKDQIAQGQAVTPADLDDLVLRVRGMHGADPAPE